MGSFVAAALLSLLAAPGPSAQAVRPMAAARLVLPPYFSGTNCRAGASSGIFGAHVGVNRFTLTITGSGDSATFTATQDWGGQPPDQQGLSIVERFDSTHFPDGSTVTVTCAASDVYGNTYGPTSASTTVINKAILYGRYEWEYPPSASTAGTPPAQQNLAQMNHDTSRWIINQGWAKDNILADIVTATAFYVNTHGNQGIFLDGAVGPNNPPPSDDDLICGSDAQAARSGGVGTGTPPFNSGLPPTWIAYVDACLTSVNDDNSLASGFLWPYTNAYDDNSCEDQAEVAWRITTDADQTQACGNAFWSALLQGHSVNFARGQIYATYNGANKGQSPYDTLAVWGDFAATLHGVYRGIDDNTRSTGWY